MHGARDRRRDNQKRALTVERAPSRTDRSALPLSGVLSAHQRGGPSIMTRHTPRWQLMPPRGKKKREKLIMSVVCGGNRAMTFPDRSDISAMCLRGFKTVENLLSRTPISETRKSFKIITCDRFYPKQQKASVREVLMLPLYQGWHVSRQLLIQSIYWVNLINLLFIKIQFAVIHVWYDGYDEVFLININADQWHHPKLLIWTEWATGSSWIFLVILCFGADF